MSAATLATMATTAAMATATTMATAALAVTAVAAGGGQWAAAMAEGGSKASENEVLAEKEPIFEGSFAICLAIFEAPVEGGTRFRQFQTSVPGIPEELRRIP